MHFWLFYISHYNFKMTSSPSIHSSFYWCLAKSIFKIDAAEIVNYAKFLASQRSLPIDIISHLVWEIQIGIFAHLSFFIHFSSQTESTGNSPASPLKSISERYFIYFIAWILAYLLFINFPSLSVAVTRARSHLQWSVCPFSIFWTSNFLNM